jgi:3-oxoacyl-[acyl-carrier-protein] synthase II
VNAPASAAPLLADVLGLGEVRPAPIPSNRAAPAPLGGEARWAAHRLEAEPGQGLFPAARLRRLGRAQAMALSAVKLAVSSREGAALDGGSTAASVSVGTAWAEIGDEVAFLENLVRRGEIGARPTYFANSVHNALASQIALEFGLRGENYTFTHDALSFESALLEGVRILRARRADRAVVVGADALTDFLELRGHLLGRFREDPSPLEPLGAPPEGRPALPGTLPGEGAAAFVLGPAGAAHAPLARLAALEARGPRAVAPPLEVPDELAFLERALPPAARPGFVLLGASGDASLDAVYRGVLEGLEPRLAEAAGAGVYRHATGDFETASALGLALAVRIVSERRLPEEVRCLEGRGAPGPPDSGVLLYHLSRPGQRSAMLVCP